MFDKTNIDWEKMEGLVPAIIQHEVSGEVLMLGYLNQEALDKTLETNRVTFYSRSKKRLWTKGETSKNFLHLRSITVDCDGDCLLIHVIPDGPSCHLGDSNCFKGHKHRLNFIYDLEQVIQTRKKELPADSYTTELFNSGIKRMAQKVGEEAVETSLAAATNNLQEYKNEVADLIFHLLVLNQALDVSIVEIFDVLAQRAKPK